MKYGVKPIIYEGAVDNWQVHGGPIGFRDRHGKLIDRFTLYADTETGIVISQVRAGGQPVINEEVGEVVKIVELYEAPLTVVVWQPKDMKVRAVVAASGADDPITNDPAVPLTSQPWGDTPVVVQA